MSYNSEFDLYLKYRSLALRFEHASLNDLVITNAEQNLGDVPLKNLCFKVSEQFDAELSRLCDALGISKRDFMVRAVCSGMESAERHLEEALEDVQ